MQFLKYVADNLRSKYRNDLSRVAVVFPNKRAGIFFDEYLMGDGESQPVWAPHYLTISEVFDSLSTLRQADDIKAVCRLYHIYKDKMAEVGEKDVSLDFFYGWGAQLLSDFSDVDRSMVDAEEIFGSWSAVHVLEQMSEEEKEALRPVFELFKAPGRLKDNFEQLWGCLYGIYRALNDSLSQDGEGYEGAHQRQTVVGLRDGSILLPEQYECFAFVGFNMLLPVEWQLFDFIKEAGKGLFYWDYDSIYAGKGKIFSFGKTMEKNMEHFPNELDDTLFDNFAHRQSALEFVAAASDNGQAHYATDWLKQHLTQEERRTAVVLCDEMLLQPVVHSLPDEVREVNITKGFPMTHTPAYAFVVHFLEQAEDKKTQGAQEPAALFRQLAESLQQQAQGEMAQQQEESWIGQLTAESYFQCYTTVNRILHYVEDGTLDVGLRTLVGLLRQILGTLSIPFHGEPASGLQIMGMLETRNLDFEEILMLSVNEGVVPKKQSDRSFIPYDLRKHYHIMTGDEQSEVYAYNFFRLLQRSGHVTLVYNASTDGEKHYGEMSRFMLQILMQTDIPVARFSLKEHNATLPVREVPVTETVSKKLMEQRRLNLSPTAIGQYIACPMKYFFSHIAHIKELQEMTAILPNNTFGSIFHRAAEKIYKSFRKQAPEAGSVEVKSGELEALADNMIQLDKFIGEAFQYVSDEDAKQYPALAARRGDAPLYQMEEHTLEAEVMREYLQRVLKYDAQLAAGGAFSIVSTERDMKVSLNEITSIHGVIDRVDSVKEDGAETKRVVDYKTGSYDVKKMQAKSFDTLFTDGNQNYVLQTMLYELLYYSNTGVFPTPNIYFIQKIGNKNYHPDVTFGDKKLGTAYPSEKEKMDGFLSELESFIGKMRTEPFACSRKQDACRYCPYTLLCGDAAQQCGG